MAKYEKLIMQIDEALAEYGKARDRSKYDDLSDLTRAEIQFLINILSSTIHRLSVPGSMHRQNFDAIMKVDGCPGYIVPNLVGALVALRRDMKAGYIEEVSELIHSETFSDFLEMASHLADQNYKDPAAVLAGTTLEQHLRELSRKNNLCPEETAGKFKKADTLNAELYKEGVYQKLENKQVTYWLGLRNEAAHGNYGAYSAEQVRIMIEQIRDFITRYPA